MDMAIIGKKAVAGKTAVTTAGTPVSLGAQMSRAGFYITAASDNTKSVYVFPAGGAKTDVYPLSAKDSIFWPVDNLNKLKLDSEVNGEGVFWRGAV